MATTEALKQERMHIRLDTLSKQKLERAAGYLHKNLSEFVVSQALSAADQVIQEHESIAMTQADWDLFLDALETPSEPNQKLKDAFSQHKQTLRR